MTDETLLAALDAHIRFVGGDYSSWRLTSDAAEAIAGRIKALVAERDEYAKMVLAFAAEAAPDAMEVLSKYRDHWCARAEKAEAEHDAAHALLRLLQPVVAAPWAYSMGQMEAYGARIEALLAGKDTP